MTEDSKQQPASDSSTKPIKPWLTKTSLAIAAAFMTALAGYFTGLIPELLDPYFGGTPEHEIAVLVTSEKDGGNIDGAQVSISEVGESDAETGGLLDSKLLEHGDTKLLAKTKSKNGRLRIEYNADGKTYRYRQLLTFADLPPISLKFPVDFDYEGKPDEAKSRLAVPLPGSLSGTEGNKALSGQKESLDNAFGEATLGLDDVARQMREAREAREAAAATNKQ